MRNFFLVMFRYLVLNLGMYSEYKLTTLPLSINQMFKPCHHVCTLHTLSLLVTTAAFIVVPAATSTCANTLTSAARASATAAAITPSVLLRQALAFFLSFAGFLLLLQMQIQVEVIAFVQPICELCQIRSHCT
jgi:hypothetical protein